MRTGWLRRLIMKGRAARKQQHGTNRCIGRPLLVAFGNALDVGCVVRTCKPAHLYAQAVNRPCPTTTACKPDM